MLILVERIAAFLREYHQPFCEECLRELLDVHSVDRITRFSGVLAATGEFRRQKGRCTLCKREMTVIEASESSDTPVLDLLAHAAAKPLNAGQASAL